MGFRNWIINWFIFTMKLWRFPREAMEPVVRSVLEQKLRNDWVPEGLELQLFSLNELSVCLLSPLPPRQNYERQSWVYNSNRSHSGELPCLVIGRSNKCFLRDFIIWNVKCKTTLIIPFPFHSCGNWHPEKFTNVNSHRKKDCVQTWVTPGFLSITLVFCSIPFHSILSPGNCGFTYEKVLHSVDMRI